MKTSIGSIRVILNHLVKSGVKASVNLTGGIYWLNRPKGSVKEDIVINSIAMSGNELQEGMFNVNIHMPNMPLSNDDTQPDFARFETITNALTPILENVWGGDYNFKIDSPAEIVPDGPSWYCNIRVRYWTVRDAA